MEFDLFHKEAFSSQCHFLTAEQAGVHSGDFPRPRRIQAGTEGRWLRDAEEGTPEVPANTRHLLFYENLNFRVQRYSEYAYGRDPTLRPDTLASLGRGQAGPGPPCSPCFLFGCPC